MSDIAKRLRWLIEGLEVQSWAGNLDSYDLKELQLIRDAANEIERLESERDEAAREVVACISFLQTLYHWEGFWDEFSMFNHGDKSAAKENAHKLWEFLQATGHGKRAAKAAGGDG